jgi:hypothetical protein
LDAAFAGLNSLLIRLNEAIWGEIWVHLVVLEQLWDLPRCDGLQFWEVVQTADQVLSSYLTQKDLHMIEIRFGELNN